MVWSLLTRHWRRTDLSLVLDQIEPFNKIFNSKESINRKKFSLFRFLIKKLWIIIWFGFIIWSRVKSQMSLVYHLPLEKATAFCSYIVGYWWCDRTHSHTTTSTRRWIRSLKTQKEIYSKYLLRIVIPKRVFHVFSSSVLLLIFPFVFILIEFQVKLKQRNEMKKARRKKIIKTTMFFFLFFVV